MFWAPPIRPHSFGEILNGIAEEARLGRSEAVRTSLDARPDMDWLFDLFVTSVPGLDADCARGARADRYFEDPIELPVIADDEDAIAAELALSRVRTQAELKQIRRAYALRNHPDLLHPVLRADATRRMKIANMLFDRRSRELARAA
ncbi:MAG: hypothetical protein ACLQIQ_07580 [Beijerinckiaceae bacterium]